MDLYTIRKELNMGIALTQMHLRVTDYARVSTDHEEQKKSLKNQTEHFEQYIKKNPNWIYIPGYVDDGITGTSDIKRDNFMKMIEDARKHKFDLIITKEISRFSRNTLDSIKYTRELLSYGVAVLFVNDNINTAMPDSELRLTIMASMAQDEIRRLSERVKFGMNHAIEKGEILGNDMLYGYRKDKNTGILNIVIEEAQIVKKIYELYAIEKLTLSNIVKILNNKNLKTRNGKKWCISTISRMIENPKYKGYYCAKKSEITDYMTKKVKYFKKNEWIIYEDKLKIPPIVSEELWLRANHRLELRKRSFSKRTIEKNNYENKYLYSAKIYCNEHKTIFHRRKFRRNEKDITWVCASYLKNGKSTCDSPNIRESELDKIINDILLKLKINFTKIEEILTMYYQRLEEENEIKKEIEKMEKEIENINTKKDKILELNIQGVLSNIEFKQKNNAWNEQIIEQRRKIEKLKEEEKKTIDNNKITIQQKELKKKINASSTRNKIVEYMINHIIVSKINNSKNNLKLKIFLFDTTINQEKESKLIYENTYEFKRGYDTVGTKRYLMQYQVSCYL